MSDPFLLQRSKFFSRFFGSIFKGHRDLYDVFGYPKIVSYEQCISMFNRGGLAKRIVAMPAEGVWSKPPVLDEVDPEADAAAGDGIDGAVPVGDIKAQLKSTTAIARVPVKPNAFGDGSSTAADGSQETKPPGSESPLSGGPDGPQPDMGIIGPSTAKTKEPLTELEKAWDKLLRDPILNLASVFEKADKLAGMGAYSVIVLGFDDATTQLKMQQPVKHASELKFVRAYSCAGAKIKEWEDDPTNPAFGMPRMYTLNPGDETSHQGQGAAIGAASSLMSKGKQNIDIHASRVIHITDDELESSVYGHPRLVNVYNHVLDLIKVVGGAAEMFWIAGNRGLHVDVDKDMTARPEDLASLAAEVEDYTNNLTRVLRTRGVKVGNLGSDVADPTGTFKTLISTIAGATGIPQRQLIGAEAGQLASQQDRANWADYLDSRRKRVAEPIYIRPFVRRLMDTGILPEAEFNVLWPEAFTMNPLERAQAAAQKGRVLASLGKIFRKDVILADVDEVRDIFNIGQSRIGD